MNKENSIFDTLNIYDFRWDKKWIWFPRIKHIKFEYYEKLNELKKEGIKFKSSKVFFDIKRKKWILSLKVY